MRIKRGMWWTYVLVFLISAGALPAVAENGCFTEPSYVARSGGCGFISEATAETNCRNQQGNLDQSCMNTYFIRVSSGITSCSDVPLCAFRPGTWCGDTCEQVNYQAQCTDRTAWVNQATAPSQCVEGCCVCASGGGICDPSDPFKNQNQCTAFCQNIGGVAVFDTSMSIAQCTNTCGNLAVSTAEVSGLVTDAAGVPIQSATIRAFSLSATTDATGSYQLRNLPAGDITLSVSHPLYESKQASTTLASGEQKQINFQLSPLGTGVIRGTVTSSGNALPGAQVVVRLVGGQSVSQAVSDAVGVYSLSSLPFGDYSVTVSAAGYQPQSSSLSLSSASPVGLADFQLILIQEGTISGTVINQQTQLGVPFARIYVNGVFVRHGGADGLFVLQLPASQTGTSYTLSVLHPDYQPDASQSALLKTGDRISFTFSLVQSQRECVYPVSKPVETFTAQHVSGEKAVKLSWAKPCNEVAGYIINRTAIVPGIAASPQKTIAFVDVTPGSHPLSAKDTSVEWGATYEYHISAVYTDVQPRLSAGKSVRITTGDARCEGRHNGFEFVEFCDVTGRLRHICTPENQVASATSPGPADCSALGTSFFCAQVGADTACKDTGVCASLFQNANPFGLWFTRFGCYGQFDSSQQRYANFCTFDRTSTIVDACVACNNVKTCFDYRGQDACLINNCGVGNCTWVGSVPELGAGYCVDTGSKEKFGTQNCALCGTSSSSSLFTNAACTGAVCTALGACYANPDTSSCLSCNDQTSCYDFGTEKECANGKNVAFSFGRLQPSADACSLGRCVWSSPSCFKDGNTDGHDDCESFFGDTQRCRRDNIPPLTTISPDIILVGDLSDQVTFEAHDDNGGGAVYYCIDRTNDCLPNATNKKLYGGNNIAHVDFGAAGLLGVYNGSPVYFIRYYSEDIFFNREDIQSKRFIADLDAPKITFNYTVSLLPSGSDIIFTIILDEPATCRDALTRRGTQHSVSHIPQDRNTSWVVVYNNQSDGSYFYNISCTDDLGNAASRVAPVIDVDALNFITVLSPSQAMGDPSFSFSVRSTDPSDCELYDGTTRVELLSSGDHLTHRSSSKTFSPNIFYTQWRVVCTELSSGERHEKLIPFTVDKQPPRTTVELVSDDGIVRAYNTTNWTAFMSSIASVSFICDDFPQEAGASVGFGCKETKYCIAPTNTSRCTPTLTGNIPGIQNSSTLCFSSSDNGANTELEKCGVVTLTPGFGIGLVQPPYGISHVPLFDLQISTLVPSTECKWVGAPPGAAAIAFNFTNLVTATNIFRPVNPYLLEIKNFSTLLPLRDGVPFPIIIRCLSSSGVVSPPQVFTVGYDTTIPRITVARAEPETVAQGNSVDLVVETDEPTLCKYGKKPAFSGLQTPFPGFERSLFMPDHRTTHTLTTQDDKQSHSFNVSCMNRAGNFSSVRQITFSVDFSIGGTITSTEPSGVLSSSGVALTARTNKDAFCEIAESNGTSLFYQQFAASGGLLHTQQRGNLSEGSYAFRVRCSFFAPSVTREALLNFTIDRTPPTITSINDGNRSCSLAPPFPSVVASDAHSFVVAYEYQLLEKPSTVIANGTLNATNGTLAHVNISLGKDYFFKLKPIDAAGNIGRESASDGFTVIPANSTVCRDDKAPVITINSTVTRTGTTVSVSCVDDNGCASVKYGTSERQETCQSNKTYSTPVAVEEDSFFCVLATDTAGITATRNEQIKVPDKDGDGVTDPFDKCADTPSGETVDDKGCSSPQLLVDKDGDGLDDSWELRYDAVNCALDPSNRDSDGNGVNDGDEDYDGDGMNNKEEFRTRNDPCSAEKPKAGTDTPGSGTETQRAPADEEPSLLAALFIVFGTFLALAGAAYLIYVHYYQKQILHPAALSAPVPRPVRSLRPSPPSSFEISPEARALALKRQEVRYKAERERRNLLFSAFGESSGPEKKTEYVEKQAAHSEQKAKPAQLSRPSTFERLSKLTGKSSDTSDALSKLQSLAQRGKKK